MTKYHRLAGLNTRHLFLPALEVGKSEIKILSDLILGKDFLPGLQTDHVLTLITPHLAFPRCVHPSGEGPFSLPCFIWPPILLD